MQDVYKNIDEYNTDKERKLIFFDDTIADVINNKKLNSVVTELFIRGRKLNISLVFITQSYIKVPKDVRLNSNRLISKQKEIFNELVDERLEEITDLDEKVNSDNLIYRYKGRTGDAKFDKFDNAFDIIHKIRNAKTSLKDVKSNQAKFKSNLNDKNRTKEQKDTLYNIEMLYKARNEPIKFYYDYSSMISGANLKQLKEQDLKY